MRSKQGPTTRHWKEFTAPAPATRTGLYASINATGVISINRRTHAALGLPKTVSLLYDADNVTIGVQPTSQIMPSAFPVTLRRDVRMYHIRAHAFVEAHRLQISYCVRFLDPHLEDGVLILDLNLTARAPTARKSKARVSATRT